MFLCRLKKEEKRKKEEEKKHKEEERQKEEEEKVCMWDLGQMEIGDFLTETRYVIQ